MKNKIFFIEKQKKRQTKEEIKNPILKFLKLVKITATIKLKLYESML